MKTPKKLTYTVPSAVIIMFSVEDLVSTSESNQDNLIGEKDYFD